MIKLKDILKFVIRENKIATRPDVGNIESRVTSRFREVEDEEEADLINNQYIKYATRANITPIDLKHHLMSGHGIIWNAYNSRDYVVGQFVGDVFTVSHFAPETMGSGVDAMNYPSPNGDGFPLSSNSFGVVQRLLRVVPTLVF